MDHGQILAFVVQLRHDLGEAPRLWDLAARPGRVRDAEERRAPGRAEVDQQLVRHRVGPGSLAPLQLAEEMRQRKIQRRVAFQDLEELYLEGANLGSSLPFFTHLPCLPWQKTCLAAAPRLAMALSSVACWR